MVELGASPKDMDMDMYPSSSSSDESLVVKRMMGNKSALSWTVPRFVHTLSINLLKVIEAGTFFLPSIAGVWMCTLI